MTIRIDTFVPLVTFVVFLALKLSGAIGWTWVWVLAPLWILGAAVTAASVAMSGARSPR